MNQRGFTMIELILASVIMAMIGTLTYGAISATFKTQVTVSERSILQEIGTAAITKMRDDLAQAFIVESPKQVTYFRGEDNTDQDKISFTTLSHLRSGPNTRESDEAEVFYDTESDPSETKLYKLRRAEHHYLDGQNKKIDANEYIVMATHVVSFNVEYSDGQTFSNTWDSKADDQRNKLPKAIRLSLKLRDEKEREENFEAFIEVPMSEGIGVVMTQPAAAPPGQPGQPGQPQPGQPGQQPGTPGRPGQTGRVGQPGAPGRPGQSRPRPPRGGGISG